ncbi:EAL domain-containing protein [Solirubrobacter sp. CPCC 204708]|uniref:EAL domain-containing protein n=1 Tax=Solirubrobacter deserti TaxID=2282478 RepID=A0ABT4RVA0_9ACTN|nr:EAL domain-containing protein [Solirubrobacter deserti]MBE2315146.1 EAL domain-containing protein [Solirubrobacter deserti]MDA0142397.1 EAL domain-containing protein [Solirubrobacter deserti]
MVVDSAFQPIVELRDGCVVGYEALARPADGSSPEALFATARAEGRLAEVDAACRAAALEQAASAGLGAPFALFLNADASALEHDVPDLPMSGLTLVMEITERALTSRPDLVLRTLTRLRTRGWAVSLDDVGADSRSLALMPLLYPDVIKLDLTLLAARAPADVARVVTAVGAEAERRHVTVLAEGIDSEEQLAMARAAGATLGQGYLLGAPAPLPDPLPEPGRPLRLAGGGGDVTGPLPYARVTNWRRPVCGPLALAERAAALLTAQAAALGPTGMLLAAPDRSHASERFEALRSELGFVGVLEAGELEDTWTEVALGPGFGACFVARRVESGEWAFATSYDRELVVECALALMARLPR